MINSKFRNWRYIAGGLGVVVFLGLGYVLATRTKAPPVSPVELPVQSAPVCSSRETLTGRCLAEPETGFYYGVMIENHGDARPVSGLEHARLVYETLAEAPITRYLAVFHSADEVPEIGPVRSARLYYVDWAREFLGPYVHVGGSPQALESLRASYPFDLNEFYHGAFFWRDARRYAPHNAYTSTALLKKAVEVQGWDLTAQTIASWKFKDEPAVARPASGSLTVFFGSAGYDVVWQYHGETNDYERFLGGEPDLTRDGAGLRARNIVVMYTESEVIDNEGRRDTRVFGDGDAMIYFDGKEIRGTWRRESAAERTRIFAETGAEIVFNPGVTWLEIVPVQLDRAVWVAPEAGADNEAI